jgi:hypothetical protein
LNCTFCEGNIRNFIQTCVWYMREFEECTYKGLCIKPEWARPLPPSEGLGGPLPPPGPPGSYSTVSFRLPMNFVTYRLVYTSWLLQKTNVHTCSHISHTHFIGISFFISYQQCPKARHTKSDSNKPNHRLFKIYRFIWWIYMKFLQVYKKSRHVVLTNQIWQYFLQLGYKDCYGIATYNDLGYTWRVNR